jgi:hypothetical protein
MGQTCGVCKWCCGACHKYEQLMWICPCARRGQNSDEHQEGTASEICAAHCTMGLRFGGGPCKSTKMVEEEKQEMLKRIAIETGKQIDQELVFPIKRRQKCTQEKIEKDYRRKEINNMHMKEVICGGYWQVIFKDNSRPIRTDETFVKANFPNAYISELMRMKKGFVDIPVGDFKVSHLSEHPSLHVHGAPRVCFPK